MAACWGHQDFIWVREDMETFFYALFAGNGWVEEDLLPFIMGFLVLRFVVWCKR